MKNNLFKIFLLLILFISLTGCKKNDNVVETYELSLVKFNGEKIEVIEYEKDSKINKIKDPIKDGYIFGGWFYDFGFTKEVKFPFTLDKNTTIYAGWYSTLIYELNEENNTYKVTKCISQEKTLVIPEEYEGKKVTIIGKDAFEGNDFLEEIKIPNSIIEIEEGAFSYCTKLKKINLPDTIEKIGKNIFSGCDEIEYENIGGIKYLNNWLVDATNTPQTKLNLKEETIGIFPYAFLENQNIEEIIIPNNVKYIYEGTFKDSSITSLKIGANVINIDISAIRYTENLTYIQVDENNKYYSSIDGVLYDKDVTQLLSYPQSKTNLKYDMPNTVVQIISRAATENKYLTNLKLSNNLIKIEEYAFYNCSKLSEINFNNKLEYIGKNSFYNCKEVKNLIIPISVKEIGESAFGKMSNIYRLEVPFLSKGNTDYPISHLFGGINNIPNSIRYLVILGGEKIKENSLSGLTSIRELVIPSEVNEIAPSALSYCNELNKITIDSNNKNYKIIGNVLYTYDEETLIYYLVSNTSSVYYPLQSTKSILKNAFNKNSNIEEIILNEGLEYIGPTAFNNLPNLKKLVISSTVKKTGQDICENTPSVTIYSSLKQKGDEWSEGWNTHNYPAKWNAYFPNFVNIEREVGLMIGDNYTITFDIENGPSNPKVIINNLNTNIVSLNNNTVTALAVGEAIIELYIEGYEEYKCTVIIYVLNE